MYDIRVMLQAYSDIKEQLPLKFDDDKHYYIFFNNKFYIYIFKKKQKR